MHIRTFSIFRLVLSFLTSAFVFACNGLRVFVDHRLNLTLDLAARVGRAIPSMRSKARAFVTRSLTHSQFSAGHFELMPT